MDWYLHLFKNSCDSLIENKFFLFIYYLSSYNDHAIVKTNIAILLVISGLHQKGE